MRITAAIALGLVTLSVAGAATGSTRLHRVYGAHRSYTMLVPAGWRLRDVSYPSDHTTHLWWTPADPLARAVVVLSGCVGCVSQNGKPNPAGAVSDAVATHRLSAARAQARLPGSAH